jgi:hypothetical protein
MPINKSNIIFIGNVGGICGYLSHGLNIIRKSSSLTTKRVAEEPEFEGFRKSGNRMKQASPIAASLYNLLTKEQKEYALYRVLTGEVLKMIKQGIEVEIIVGKLKQQYIDPILAEPLETKNQSLKDKPNTNQSKNKKHSSLFTEDLFRIPSYSRCDRRHLMVKRVLQHPNGGGNQVSFTEEQISNDITFQKHLPDDIFFQQAKLTRKQKRITQFSAFVYMGRLKECKGLKMWLRWQPPAINKFIVNPL